jgi:hypothetical protein
MKLQRLCSWCRKDLDTGKILSELEYKIFSPFATHGICADCLKKQEELDETSRIPKG